VDGRVCRVDMTQPELTPANDVTPENVTYLALVVKVGAHVAEELEDPPVCRRYARAA